jgi:hypothetical protein
VAGDLEDDSEEQIEAAPANGKKKASAAKKNAKKAEEEEEEEEDVEEIVRAPSPASPKGRKAPGLASPTSSRKASSKAKKTK